MGTAIVIAVKQVDMGTAMVEIGTMIMRQMVGVSSMPDPHTDIGQHRLAGKRSGINMHLSHTDYIQMDLDTLNHQGIDSLTMINIMIGAGMTHPVTARLEGGTGAAVLLETVSSV